MKNLYLIAFITLTFASCSTKQQHSLKDWNLNGKVESIESQDYNAVIEKGEVTQGDKRYASLRLSSFDINGFQSETINYNNQGAIERTTAFKIENNHIAEITLLNSSNKITGTAENEYENGNIINQTYTNESGMSDGKAHYQYNSDGQITIISNYNSTNLKQSSSVMAYAGKNPSEMTIYDSSGASITKQLYKYDSHNNRSEVESFRKGVLSFKEDYTYEYDNKENWVRCQIINEKYKTGIITIRKIKYYSNSSGKLSTSDLMGMWKENQGQAWIEFKENNKYDSGMGVDLNDSGSIELSSDGSLLTLNSKDNNKSKKIYLEFTGNSLKFKSISGIIEATYVHK